MSDPLSKREAIQASNRRRASTCPKCGSISIRELEDADIARRDDLFFSRRYKECFACGYTWVLKGSSR